MSFFLLVFFLLYGGMHYHAFRKITSVVTLAMPLTICLALFMAAMTVMPVMIRLIEKEGFEHVARALAYAGYVWMGLLFLFFCASITIDLCGVLLRLAGHVAGKELPLSGISESTAILLAGSCALIIALYGYSEALDIRTERVVVASNKIPAEIGRIAVVQISDVHLGLIVGKERLDRIVRAIRKADPDILVSTGDLVDSQIDGMTAMAAALGGLKPRFGKYAVTGNHEYYAGITQALEFTRKAGFTVLGGDSRDVAGIRLAGVADPVACRMGAGCADQEKTALASRSPGEFTVLLKHRPTVEKCSQGHFDLQLSGHVHQGQIFPFSLVTRLLYPRGSGLATLAGGGALYVSRGTGTWGPPLRFLAPPEITVIELVRPDVRGTGQPAGNPG